LNSRWLIIVLAVGVVLRVAMLVDFLQSHPGAYVMQGDALAYWSMAGEMASGKLIGTEPYLSAPLYGYFLAMIRAVGGGLLMVYVLQLVLHLVTAFLLGKLVERRMDVRSGALAAAVFLLLMEPAFYVTRVLPTTLQLLIVVLVMHAADRAERVRTLCAFAILGVTIGALALIYPTAMGLLAVLPLWILWTESRGPNDVRHKGDYARWIDGAWEKAVIAVLCAVVIILPATLHNWAASGEFIPITAHGGITLRQGNSPEADGIYTPIPGISQTRETMHADALALYETATGSRGGYAEVDRFFRRQAWDFLATDVSHSIWLVARKFYWFLSGRHYSDIVYPTLEQKDGWVHLLPLAPVHSAWLMGPALLGMIVGWRVTQRSLWNYLLVLLPLATVCLFWYSPRYRAPVLPLLVLFTVAAVRWSDLWVRDRDTGVKGDETRKGRIALALLLGAAMLTGPINAYSGFDRSAAYRPQYEYNRGQLYVALKQFDLAAVHFEAADQLTPGRPHILAALVDAYARTNRRNEAETAARRLTQSDPNSASSWLLLGGLQLRSEDWPSAIDTFQHAVEALPNDVQLRVGLGLAYAGNPAGDEGAEQHLRAAVRMAPNHPLAVCELGRWLFAKKQFAEAESLLRHCVKLTPERRDIADLLAQLANNFYGAQPGLEALRAQIAANPDNPNTYSQLAGELFQRGNLREALDVLRLGASDAKGNSTLLLELAWVLATSPDSALLPSGDVAAMRHESVTYAERALSDLETIGPEALDVLAAAYASVTRFAEAAAAARKAYNLAVSAGNNELAGAIGERMKLFEAGRPYLRE